MKNLLLALLIILFVTVTGWSQSLSRVTSGLDLGTGYNEKVWIPALTYHQELSLRNFPWFRIGWGLRGSGYFAGRTDLLPKTNAYSGDTLQFGKISTTGISMLVGASIRVWHFDIGANTDLVGIAFGTKRGGLYSNGSLFEGQGAPYYNKHVPSSPATINALPLILDRQNGQSELFLRYWITERLGVKVGYSYGRVTYASEVKLDNGQRRYSKMWGVPFAALSFPLYN